MNFLNEEHELFFVNKLKELYKQGKCDVYYQSLVYTLGVCETTRNHFENIFDMKTGQINIDAINMAWQTSTSQKVTRMAFNLWNGCMYDSEADIEQKKRSSEYSPDEIFSCSYAPYFYAAIKLRYPEYTKDTDNMMEL